MAGKEETEKLGSITLKFKTTIASDGGINRVAIHQYGNMIQLTGEQARSLANTILIKLGEKP